MNEEYLISDNEEREQMEFEDKIVNIISYSIFIGIIAIIVLGGIYV